jgi:hypothetical protein
MIARVAVLVKTSRVKKCGAIRNRNIAVQHKTARQ